MSCSRGEHVAQGIIWASQMMVLQRFACKPKRKPQAAHQHQHCSVSQLLLWLPCMLLHSAVAPLTNCTSDATPQALVTTRPELQSPLLFHPSFHNTHVTWCVAVRGKVRSCANSSTAAPTSRPNTLGRAKAYAA
jgi:hypothetical protein